MLTLKHNFLFFFNLTIPKQPMRIEHTQKLQNAIGLVEKLNSELGNGRMEWKILK